MLSTHEFSGDAIATKSHFIAQEWGLMWSAEDASHITPIWEMTRVGLYPKRLHVHCPEVANTVAKAYQRQLTEEATARYLARYGLSMAEFLKDGTRLFPAAQYEEMHREIRTLTLGCDFIGYGFDDSPHIFRVSEPGKITYEDEVGFAAIGSGWYSAISTFFFHSVNRSMDLWEVVYHVLEAKFMAESAPGVGAETHAEILDQNGQSTYLFDGAVDEFRAMWLKGGMPRVPKKAEDQTREIIKACRRGSRQLDKQFNKEMAAIRQAHLKKGKALKAAMKTENSANESPH
jgi:hypothetical protein